MSVEKKVEVLLNDKKFFSEGKGDEKFSDLSSKAMFWSNCKKNKKCTKEPYSRLLKNPAYEKDWNNYLEKKEATKEIVALSQEEKIEVLLKEEKIFSRGKGDEKFSDLSSKAKFWAHCKSYKRCLKEPYSKLLEIPAYKQDWDAFTEKFHSS